MKTYQVRAIANLSQFVEVKEDSLEKAIESVKKDFENGEIFPDIEKSEFYDGYEVEVENVDGKTYDLRVKVQLSLLVETEAEDPSKAINNVTEQFYNDEFMSDIRYDEYFDGFYAELEE